MEAEGFESFAHFVARGASGEKRRFRPLHVTTVFRVRPWDSDDDRAMADALLARLYGEFLGAGDSHPYRSSHPSLYPRDDETPLGFGDSLGSRRPDSNRGPLHYE